MNKEQREDLAKLLYDFAKISFAALIIGNIVAWERFDEVVFSVGIAIIFLAVVTGLTLRSSKKVKRK